LAATGLSIGLGIMGGVIAGAITSLPFFEKPFVLFDDRDNWTDCRFPKENENYGPSTNVIDNPEKTGLDVVVERQPDKRKEDAEDSQRLNA